MSEAMCVSVLITILVFNNYNVISKDICFYCQGKGLQKTYWLQGRRGQSLPLLGSPVDVGCDKPAVLVQTIDDWFNFKQLQ